MKIKLFLIIVFLQFSAKILAQQVSPIIIGEQKNLKSEILKENRTLNIYLPQNFDETKSYPVIYLLDGTMNEDFLHIVGLVDFFRLQFKMPETIIVGIANVDRKRDFTFHTDNKDLQKKYPTTGHSETFINFLEKELQPFIEKNFKTEGTKYIIGQSLGGLLATEILLKKPQLFSHYFIVSPSLWWDNESLYNDMKNLISKQNYDEKFIYISAGKEEEKIMVKDADGLFNAFKSSGKKIKQLELNLLNGENHATVLHNALYQGFLKIFPYKE